MDPLSVTASIVGILAAAGKIYELLHMVVSSAKDAPQVVTALMFEVDDVRSAFASLQNLLADLSSAPPRRTAMVQVDRLIVTLTETVLTFSELEAVITPLVVTKGQKYPLRTRLRWTRIEPNCEKMVAKLQRHKSSVSLMLNVLQCTSDVEAARSQASLEIMVEQLLQTNRGLCKRMRNLEDAFDARTIRTTSQFDGMSLMSQGDTATLTTMRQRTRNRVSMVDTFRIRFAFDDDLESSRVYSRVMLDDSCDRSFNSSAVRTKAWSVFSGLSLADISIVSVVALPLYASDITNQDHYSFGDTFTVKPAQNLSFENDVAQTRTQDQSSRELTGWWKRFQEVNAFRRNTQQTASIHPSRTVIRLDTVVEVSSEYAGSKLALPSNSPTHEMVDRISPDESLSWPPSLISGPVTPPKDGMLKKQLSEIMYAQQMLEDYEDALQQSKDYDAVQTVVMGEYVSLATNSLAHGSVHESDRHSDSIFINPLEHDRSLNVHERSEMPDSSLLETGPTPPPRSFNMPGRHKPEPQREVDSGVSSRSPCPICSGGYLNEGQILELAETERHDGCRICSECGEQIEWIAQVVFGHRGMPAILCTICIGNSSTAIGTANRAAVETAESHTFESANDPVIEHFHRLVNEPVIEPARAEDICDASCRRRTWDGSTQNKVEKREAKVKRLSLDLETERARTTSDRRTSNKDYNFWQDERFPIVQTWREKAKNILARQEYSELSLPLTGFPLGSSMEDSEMDVSMNEHASQALSLFDFSLEGKDQAENTPG